MLQSTTERLKHMAEAVEVRLILSFHSRQRTCSRQRTNDVVHGSDLRLADALIYINLDTFDKYINISHLLINASSPTYYVRRLSHLIPNMQDVGSSDGLSNEVLPFITIAKLV